MEASLKIPMMIRLTRLSYSAHGTFGVLTVNGEHPIYTLEETELQIPAGTYPVEITYSPKFKRRLPLLIVPHRSAIRIHEGNWPRDSSGCLLIGMNRSDTMLTHSRAAVDFLVPLIQRAIDEHIYIEIEIR